MHRANDAGVAIKTPQEAAKARENLRILHLPKEHEIKGLQILCHLNIHIEDLSSSVVSAMKPRLIKILSDEYDGSAAEEQSNNLLQEMDPHEIDNAVDNAFRDEQSCRRLDPLLRALVERNRWNVPTLGGKGSRKKGSLDLFKFFQDPALASVHNVITFLPQKVYHDNPKLALMIGRNLHRKEAPVTRILVEEEQESIEEFQRTMKDILVVGPDRAVTFVANNEYYFLDKKTGRLFSEEAQKATIATGKADVKDFERVPFFAREATLDGLKVAGGPLNVIQVMEDASQIERGGVKNAQGQTKYEAYMKKLIADIDEKRQQVYKDIEFSPPPHTFIFSGHGLPDSFALTNSDKISYTGFATALRKRYEKFKGQSPLLQKDVFIFGSCYSTNLTMNTDAALKGTDYRPIFIATNEYGQVGYGDPELKTGSKFLEHVLGISEAKPQTITLGDIMRRQDKGDADVSIFIPRKDKPKDETILEQISQLPEKEKGNMNAPQREAA